MKYFICLICFFLFCSVLAQEETLEAPSSEDETICGAGYLTFTATSDIANNSLRFEWYEVLASGQLQFLGSLDGSTGRSQFITSFLISDRNFAVRVSLGSQTSPYTFVKAEVLNEASIVQQPEIQLCGEVNLEVETNMDSIEMYQWQILVPDEFGQSFFQNLTTASSDSVILVATETGFYRAVVTDSTGCQAISSEVEVTNDPIVTFINSAYKCYDSTVPDSDVVKLTSDYGRTFTSYQWEVSLDSVNYTVVGTSQSIDVSKPTAQAFDTAYYRLTITEQNCANDTTIGVYWRPVPDGTIRHVDAGIDQDDFFYCNEDANAMRTLRFESTSPNIEVQWISVNFLGNFPLDTLKKFSGATGPADYFAFKELAGLQITEKLLGTGNEVTLDQNDGDPLRVDGGLIFAIVNDTIAECGGVTNGIFADTAFPFPMFGSRLAYDYEFGDFVAACVGEELEFTSYDQSADAYTWLSYDEDTDTYTPVDTDATFTITVDESYTGGTYFLEVTKNGCTGLSEGFNVASAEPPSVEITNVNDVAVACTEIPSVLLVGQGSNDVVAYQWLYSIDDINYFPAPGDSSKHFYFATLNGYYKLEASNSLCIAETESVRVEIPVMSGIDFVEVGLVGEQDYCEGENVVITCDYEGVNASYFWYYSFFQLEGDDPSIELVELGGTTNPQITLDSRIFGESLTEPMVLYFYILVIDGDCIAGSSNIPFTVSINPNPNIEILFTDMPASNELLFCGEDTFSQEVMINNLSGVDIPGLTYRWMKYDAITDSYDTIQDATDLNYTITEPGRYQGIAITADESCVATSNSLDILEIPTGITGTSLFCGDVQPIILEAFQNFAGDLDIYSYQWFFSQDGIAFDLIEGESSSLLTILPEDEYYGPGIYYYVADYDGCLATSDTLAIVSDLSSFNSIFSVERSQVKGIPFEASVSIEAEALDFTYEWAPEEYIIFTDGPRAVFNFPESFLESIADISVRVTNAGRCEVNYSYRIELEDPATMTFSKFVSPNGDGLNDLFRISGIDTSIANQLKVIDSWGNELFSYSNYYNETTESEALVGSLKAEGVYYYVFRTENGVIKGSFYLTK